MVRTPKQRSASKRNLISARKARSAKKGVDTKVNTPVAKTKAGGGVTAGHRSKEKLSYNTNSNTGRGPIRMSGT